MLNLRKPRNPILATISTWHSLFLSKRYNGTWNWLLWPRQSWQEFQLNGPSSHREEGYLFQKGWCEIEQVPWVCTQVLYVTQTIWICWSLYHLLTSFSWSLFSFYDYHQPQLVDSLMRRGCVERRFAYMASVGTHMPEPHRSSSSDSRRQLRNRWSYWSLDDSHTNFYH